MHSEQLRTLAAIVDHGSFEAAAAVLHVTPSAVSQRMKALEASVGQVLLRRGTPCSPTDAGAVLVRTARQVALLEADALVELGERTGAAVLPVVVNADSLDTWFPAIFSVAATWDDTTLRIEVEDQDHSRELLRRGDVLAAVTSDRTPVAGCTTLSLGAMRYIPAAAPDLLSRHGGAWAELPVVRFNPKDDLQHQFRREQGLTEPAAVVQVPSPGAFVAAVRAGLGWGLIPEPLLGESLERGELVPVGGRAVDLQLYWQSWKLPSARIARLTAAVRDAARLGLRPPH